MLFFRSVDDGEDVGFAEDEHLLIVDRDLAPTVLPVQDLVADLHLERQALPILPSAGPNGEHFALLWLFLCGVGNEEATSLLLGFLNGPYDDAVGQRQGLD